MAGTHTSTRLREDFKVNGEWMIFTLVTHSPYVYEHIHSISGMRWVNVGRRCLEGGHEQKKHPNYIGCKNNFTDFQQFVEWSRLEVGYQEFEENGNAWCLDKDILGNDSKTYSPETCLFVPNRVNIFLTARGALRGNAPLGVCWNTRTKKYQAQMTLSGRKVYLGSFDDPMEGHRAWQLAKINTARDIANEYKGWHDRLNIGLNVWADKIQSDYENYRETIKL